MRLHQRIIKLEDVLLTTELNEDNHELDRVCSWLAQHSEEFVECVRQLFRLQCKNGQYPYNLDQWEEPYIQHASIYFNRINELIEEHKGAEFNQYLG
ncbi:hypothetical protein FA002_00385 [Priestia megaterium]|uniref:hypothetical protein n=1 Tax=Priestia megaterium TaxID=1404 RepID=UPI0010ABACF5|nr:hypothetical protein [Priestia megaterium]TJZ40062.1 hypothetical protein FA002_00385 [Priestia megaterium]